MEVLSGNLLIGQSGGPTNVINASLAGLVSEAKKHGAIKEIYGALHGVKGIMEQDLIDLRAESDETMALIADTPSAALGSVRKKPTEEECARIFDVFSRHDIRYFFYIGGNDSAETAHIINTIADDHNYELRVFHVPKTIDNDLLVTDHCPGYGSAARYVSMALMGDNLDNMSLGGIKVDVIMGRHAGFLAAASALGRQHDDDGPHLVYLPERAFDMEKFALDVEKIYNRLGRCVIAVSEGIADADGNPVYKSGEVDSHGNVQLSGTGALGDFLVSQLKKKLGDIRMRADTFGYLQRCFPAAMSPVDRDEAFRVGVEVVEAAVTDRDNGSIAIKRTGEGKDYSSEMFVTELANVAKHTRSVPDEFINDQGNGITDSFVKYALPLVGELPRMGRLGVRKVPQK